MYDQEKEFYLQSYGESLIGIPFMLDQGEDLSNDSAFIILTNLGDNLHSLHKICGSKFSQKTILNIGIEIVNLPN